MMKQATVHGAVAAELRAELGRQKLSVNRIPGFLGKSQTYWQRRISGDMVLDVDDLAMLAELLGVPISRFFEEINASSRPVVPDGRSKTRSKRRSSRNTSAYSNTRPYLKLA